MDNLSAPCPSQRIWDYLSEWPLHPSGTHAHRRKDSGLMWASSALSSLLRIAGDGVVELAGLGQSTGPMPI